MDCTLRTTGSVNGHEYVDLGLSVKWATCNVGANKPEEFGDYYAWGETIPKDKYTIETYKFRISGDWVDNVKYSKYNTKSDHGIVDNKTTLDLVDDVAHIKWGGSWRMPNEAELRELCENTIWRRIIVNGIKGFCVTSKKTGYTGCSIFLPSSGCRIITDLSCMGISCAYLSSSLREDPCFAWYMQDYYFIMGRTGGTFREYGHTVRPVCL